jgi:hypothetical protein
MPTQREVGGQLHRHGGHRPPVELTRLDGRLAPGPEVPHVDTPAAVLELHPHRDLHGMRRVHPHLCRLSVPGHHRGRHQPPPRGQPLVGQGLLHRDRRGGIDTQRGEDGPHRLV